ncbi:hypothetical protein GGTG_04936 [Gaeumannomyces tritici R3-111a-1]|uniref:Uncharacterized protein n=1 Tax=Gaeumannomyces tritici (strain R3-111a-1) TaxID=644352 RepID=J3NUI0_GAET3|nr:hypothetical protein GGTG_04936 [Gaeumannomyces tritici R3-111a-1]EJT79853.1 hypothetical protein GGTG_04936 [Gaeumannomyces tritici R3-111a-1]
MRRRPVTQPTSLSKYLVTSHSLSCFHQAICMHARIHLACLGRSPGSGPPNMIAGPSSRLPDPAARNQAREPRLGSRRCPHPPVLASPVWSLSSATASLSSPTPAYRPRALAMHAAARGRMRVNGQATTPPRNIASLPWIAGRPRRQEGRKKKKERKVRSLMQL